MKKRIKKIPCISRDSSQAIDGARTRGLDLGKVARYQLRHYRILYLVHHSCEQDIFYYAINHLSTNILIFS